MLFPITKGEGKWPSRLLPMVWRTNSGQAHLLPAAAPRIGGKGKGFFQMVNTWGPVCMCMCVCVGGGLHRFLNVEALWCLEFNLGLWGQRKGRTKRKELHPHHLMALWDGNAAVKEKVSMTAGYSDVNLNTTSMTVCCFTGKGQIQLFISIFNFSVVNSNFQSMIFLVHVGPALLVCDLLRTAWRTVYFMLSIVNNSFNCLL